MRDSLVRATEGASLLGPASLPWEVGNALVAAVRRRRLTGAAALDAWAQFTQVPVQLVEVDGARALELALTHGLYAYDGYVLEAAMSQGSVLLTLDQPLQRAAAAAGVTLLEVQ